MFRVVFTLPQTEPVTVNLKPGELTRGNYTTTKSSGFLQATNTSHFSFQIENLLDLATHARTFMDNGKTE